MIKDFIDVWICKTCDHQYVPKSIQDLRDHASHPVPEDLELHKSYVDKITIACPKCQGEMKRTKEVIDVWFNSGSMRLHNIIIHLKKELFEKQFPADVVVEGVNQTLGWFYSLYY